MNDAPVSHPNSSRSSSHALPHHRIANYPQYFEAIRRNILPVTEVQCPTYAATLHREIATIHDLDHARLIRSLDLCRETDRYQTFNSDWPLDSAPSGREMAASGWFYLGNLDRTQCFSCKGELLNWRRMNNPNTEHLRLFPHCAMAQGRESRNIPHTSIQGPVLQDTERNKLTAEQRSILRITFPCDYPETPSMASEADRVNSFINWRFTQATPQKMGKAGFFAQGVRDRVKCFYCNGVFQNWQQNDDPWVEHAKWYPTCEFLLQQRGPEYIHTIVARFPNINRPILHAPGQSAQMSSQDRASEERRDFDSAVESASRNAAEQNLSSLSFPIDQMPNASQRLTETEEEKSCKICMNAERDIVFIPCGHICCCMECSQEMRKCPICRRDIENAIKTFMA